MGGGYSMASGGGGTWLLVDGMGDQWATTGWSGFGCQTFTRISGSGGPSTIQVCCGS